jgi:GNAT superfamily N-acetyltransferase
MAEYATAFKTARFAVSHVHCERNEEFGFLGRDVFIAFHRLADIPSPLCIVTLDHDGFVEWVEVPKDHRREGIATEVLTGLEKHVGSLELSGVTEEGEAFVNAFCPEAEAQ